MRKMGIVLGILIALVLTAPALAQVMVIGPGMVGHPGDDPSVGYSAVELDQKTDPTPAEVTTMQSGANESLRPWEESWYQLNLFAGV